LAVPSPLTKEDNQVHADGLVQDQYGEQEVHLEVDAQCNTVDHVRLHAVEDLTRNLDGGNDG
jgi:hypothetical protein